MRDKLLDSDPEKVTAITRQLVETDGQPLQVDVEAKYQQGIISERLYKVLSAQAKNRD